MSPSSSELLLIDPSLLLSEEGLAWLEEDEAARSEIVISRTLAESLAGERDLDLSQFIAPEDEAGYPERIQQLAILLEGVETFSYKDVDLPPAEARVRDALLDSNESDRELLADEWAFLVSNSWMAAKLHYALDKFRDAGAAIVEYGRRLRDEMISVVVPKEHIPAILTPDFLNRVTIKWLVLGGTAAGLGVAGVLVPPAAVAAVVAGGGVLQLLEVPGLRAFDP